MALCQLKEEETANSSILAAIKAAEEAVLQDIRNLKVKFYFSKGSSLCVELRKIEDSISEDDNLEKISNKNFTRFSNPSFIYTLSKLPKEMPPTRTLP